MYSGLHLTQICATLAVQRCTFVSCPSVSSGTETDNRCNSMRFDFRSLSFAMLYGITTTKVNQEYEWPWYQRQFRLLYQRTLIINNFVCDLYTKSIHPLVFFISHGDLLSNFHGLWNWMSQQKGILWLYFGAQQDTRFSKFTPNSINFLKCLTLHKNN
jgi:hypothetical protein